MTAVVRNKNQIHLEWKKNCCSFQSSLKIIHANCNLKIMKLETTEFKSCLSPQVLFLRELFEKNGYEIRIVGGAVRDLLLDIQPKDLDFATTALPYEMKQMFTENSVKMININGEKHGTISVSIDKQPFEFTTLRVDKVTDGRHAEIEFTSDWKLDANRRDLTINAMYLDFDGNLYDYFNGYEDLKNRRIVFVGDAADRIKEDYLRILRYFRFYGKVAEVPDNHDKYTLKAIKENAHGLQKIAKERIWTELTKVLSGRFAGELIQKLISLNIGPYIGFPDKCNEVELKNVSDRIKMNDLKVEPMTLLVSIFHNEDELSSFCDKVKPSNAQRNLLFLLLEYRHSIIDSNPIKFYQNLLLQKPNLRTMLKECMIELLKYKGEVKMLQEFEKQDLPVFPVNGHMLKDKGIVGKSMQFVIMELKKIWILNDFKMSAEELLEKVPEIMKENSNKRQKTKEKS